MTGKQSIRAGNVQAATLAALELFYKHGIDNTTINDIAVLAGVSKMSIFRYFDTKADIVSTATDELFKTVDDKFQESHFSDDADHLTGMQLAKNYLKTYHHLIDYHPRFLNYLCEVVLFFSKQEIPYVFPKYYIIEDYWIQALERGMADKTIAHIENYQTSHQTIHNLFMGVNLRLYLKSKNLSSPDILYELKGQTQRIVDMTIKYLTP